MTTEELHKILDNEDKKLSVKELKEVICELKKNALKEMNDVVYDWAHDPKNREDYVLKNGFYCGKGNAFQIALDLLKHLDSNKTEV